MELACASCGVVRRRGYEIGPILVIALRAKDCSIEEIAAALTLAGTPVSAQTVWAILHAEGLERLPRRRASERGPAPRVAPVKAEVLCDWPAGEQIPCDHAGLFLLVPGLVDLGLPERGRHTFCVSA